MQYLKARVGRIANEKTAQEALAEEQEGDPALARRPGRIGSREARCRAVELRGIEDRLRAEIDCGLEAQRAELLTAPLGLDVLCHEAGLDHEERMVLLAAGAMGISQTVGEEVFHAIAQRYGALSTSDIISVLDPRSIADWLRLRKLFRPGSALVSQGLVHVSRIGCQPGPDTLMSAEIRLSLDTFAKITGDPDALTEGE